MSGTKKPQINFRVGDQAWVLQPSYGRGVKTIHIRVEVIDAKRTYVVVRALDPSQRLQPDKTDYHMETGIVRNRDRFGNYAPRLVTLAEHEINIRTNAARDYLFSNGIHVHELRGFWREQGPLALAQVLQQAEADHYLKTRNQENRS